jgi:hypothetical protein
MALHLEVMASLENGFRIVAGSEAYSSICKIIAEEAADLMAVQEKGMANHYTDSPLKGAV